MRNRASTTPVGSITNIPWEEPLAAVGKPYKLPAWSTVCRNLLAPKWTLCASENRSDSAAYGLSLFDLNGRARYESA
jgi:hypothetical protein